MSDQQSAISFQLPISVPPPQKPRINLEPRIVNPVIAERNGLSQSTSLPIVLAWKVATSRMSAQILIRSLKMFVGFRSFNMQQIFLGLEREYIIHIRQGPLYARTE
jgi:hypothetical protein